MPTVTLEGGTSFEVEAGKKLVQAIEDSGIDIMHYPPARLTLRQGF